MEPPDRQQGHGLRNGLLLATGLVVLALVVGLVAVVVVLHRVGDAVGTAVRDVGPENPGAPDRLTVSEGAAFTFHQQRFQAGWTLSRDGRQVRPQRLRFTGEDESSMADVGYLDVHLYRRGTLVGVSHCHSEDTLEPGSPNQMICSSVVPRDMPVDRLEVADFRLAP